MNMNLPEQEPLCRAIGVIEKYCGQIELVSYGLAPNPNGFCYEVIDTEEKYGPIVHEELDSAINYLSDEHTSELRKLYL